MTYHEHYEKRIKHLQDMVAERDKEICLLNKNHKRLQDIFSDSMQQIEELEDEIKELNT